MKRIWTPEQLTPEGWDPNEWEAAHSWDKKNDEKKTIKVKIIAAKYHREQESILLLGKFPDGSSRTLPIYKTSFTFNGKTNKETPKYESDKEMEKLAYLLNAKKGKNILVEAFNIQI